jgi:cathepsin L
MKLSRKDPSSFNNIPNITIPEKLNLTDTTSVSTSTSTSTPTSTTVNLSQIKSENKNKNKNKQLAPINWVTAGMVAPVKNQGECGACWAYAATGMLESFYAIKNKRTFTEFSIQEMLDCTSAYTGLPGSCYGGSHSFAMYFAYNYAMNYETDYPLIGTQGICKLDLPEVSELLMTKGVYPVISEMEFKSSVTPQELYDILTNGPVAINIDASIDEFLFYSSGILSYACNAERSNHIMLLVGYGFDQESQQEYWLVKNSWGVNWGEKGYARLLKSDDWDGCYMYTNVVALK